MEPAIITIEEKPDGGLKIKLNFDPQAVEKETPAQNAAMVMLRLFQARVAELGIQQREAIR